MKREWKKNIKDYKQQLDKKISSVIINNLLVYLPDIERDFFRERTFFGKDFVEKKGILSIKHFTKNHNIHIKFGFLIMFFIVYQNYCGRLRPDLLDPDLIKKLKVYYCMNPEKLQEELDDLIVLNDELNKIQEEIVVVASIKITELNKEEIEKKDVMNKRKRKWQEKIEENKQELEECVININLIDGGDTERLDPTKINVLDSDSTENFKTVIYVNKDQARWYEGNHIVVYGFETQIDDFKIDPLVETIDFYFPSLKKVGDNWMRECEKLKTANFSGLSSLTTVGNYWMSECDFLESPNFNGLSNLKTVGDSWMMECERLESPNFSGLSKLETVGHDWMAGCKKLKTPQFVGLSSLKRVGNFWMLSCDELKSPNFVGLTSLTTVGSGWMWSCAKLETPNFIGLSSLRTVGSAWMESCENLKTPNFIGLKSLTTIGEDWMSNCENLTTPNFVGLESLEEGIDWRSKNWMRNCNKLQTPDFTSSKRKKHIFG